jgi:hypothetical protein
LAPEEFRKKLRRLQPFRQSVTVPAVGAENGILGLQVLADTHGDCFLPDIGMTSPVDQSFLVSPCQLLF